VSADTIVPGITNPQNLNRYSYVTNNPLRYIDPSGHARIENEFGGGCSTSGYCGGTIYSPPPSPVNYCDTHPNACSGPGNNGGSSGGSSDDGGGAGKPLFSPANTENSYCGGGSNGWYNFFDCGANITQDLALAIDTPFAALDVWLITLGCFDGPGGCLAGALVADTVFNVTGANLDETVLSAASAGFSVFADASDDGRLGESSVVSVVAAAGGAFSPDPILDFAIDGFGAGYNHEIKPISNFIPFIQSLFSH
jgi:hypothetical protein